MPEVIIQRLGHHGDGIAPGPIYVTTALPGEHVSGDVDQNRIEAPKILTPSPDRVAAPCVHFKRCGGCSLQHASDSFVQAWKVDIVREALSAHDMQAPIRNTHTSPPRSRRRATFSGRRTKSGALVGFHGRASGTLYDVPECQLVLPQILDLMPALKELTLLGASRKAAITLAVTWSEGGADVVVGDAKALEKNQIPQAVAVAQTHNLARLTWADETLVERSAPTQRFDGIPVTPPPGAFLQATEPGQTTLLSAVLETIQGAKSVVDLFAGCGTFSLPVAKHADVLAVESDTDMLSALDKAWRQATGLHQVRTETRDLFRRPLLATELTQDVAVIDPPRAGAQAQTAELATSGVSKVTMVSCNPVTFARDAKTLIQAGFTLNWLDVVDQFRWSPHIELVGAFTR